MRRAATAAPKRRPLKFADIMKLASVKRDMFGERVLQIVPAVISLPVATRASHSKNDCRQDKSRPSVVTLTPFGFDQVASVKFGLWNSLVSAALVYFTEHLH